MKYIVLVLLIVVAVMMTACSSQSEVSEDKSDSHLLDTGIPCHAMPDGSMMGDCSNEDMAMSHSISTVEEFVVEMVPHHQEAVDTSIIIVANTENEELKKLAEEIIIAQEAEINMMNEWIVSDYEGGYEAKYQNMMPDLNSLSGVELDNAYLEGMIHHHEMAVIMSENVLELNPPQKVADFAQTVIEVQSEEIALMKSLLE